MAEGAPLLREYGVKPIEGSNPSLSATSEHGLYCSFGIHGQVVYADSAAGVVIAKQSTHPLAWDEKRFSDLLCGFRAIGREFAS